MSTSQPDEKCYQQRPKCLCLSCGNYYYRWPTACCNDNRHITLRETFSCSSSPKESAMPGVNHGGAGILQCRDYKPKEGQMSLFGMQTYEQEI